MGGLGAVWHATEGRKDDTKIYEEIREGKCTLSLVNGRCIRVAQVVVLEIKQMGGIQCMQVGKWNPLEEWVDVKLPGSKVRAGETPMDAANRLLDEEFKGIKNAPSLDLVNIETDTKEEESKSYAIPSKYIRTKFCYTLEDSFNPLENYEKKEFPIMGGTVVTFICKAVKWETKLYAWLNTSDSSSQQDPEQVRAWLAVWRKETEVEDDDDLVAEEEEVDSGLLEVDLGHTDSLKSAHSTKSTFSSKSTKSKKEKRISQERFDPTDSVAL